MEFKIGFIGLGIMGESMAENIIKNGYETYVYDINQEQVDKLAALGGNPCGSIAEVAENATHVIIMVPSNPHVRDVIGQLLPAMKPGTIVIDMSTISPIVSLDLATQVKARGCIMIDAPVVKSKAAALSGDLGILVGGDEEVYEQVIPLLQCMGKNIIYMGSNGSGLFMKLCHNMLVGEIQNGVNEMLVLAKNAGLSFADVVTAVSYGGGQNFYLDSKGASLKDEDFTPKFPFEHMYKDMNLVRDISSELGLDLPGAKHVLDVYEKGMAEGLNGEDFSASIKIVEEMTKKEDT
jgi:3-hydroxyisobutyrate dehydrogenase